MTGSTDIVASKARLFEMQSAGRWRIFGTDDDAGGRMWNDWRERGDRKGLWARRGADLTTETHVGDQASWPALQGPHNAQNAALATAVAEALGIDERTVALALRSFTGLPHRMERVATLEGVAYIDDSKATNPESAAPALAAFPRVHWIVGGRAKGDDLDACLPHLSHVARAYTIGEAGPRFAEVLRPHVSVAQCGTLALAVNAAWSAAFPGDTVLLSPAAASFDQFADYAARGARVPRRHRRVAGEGADMSARAAANDVAASTGAGLR